LISGFQGPGSLASKSSRIITYNPSYRSLIIEYGHL
jgi:hypothetical protein